MTLTILQEAVQDNAIYVGDQTKKALLEAIGILESQGEIDLRVVSGAVCAKAELTQNLIETVNESVEVPEFAIPYVNWDILIPDWLASEDAVAVQTSLGTVIIWRMDVDEELQEYLADLKSFRLTGTITLG